VADALLGPGGVQVAVAEKVSLVDDRVPHSVLLEILRMKASAQGLSGKAPPIGKALLLARQLAGACYFFRPPVVRKS
jgi:hypothetical protein